jgi:hypothetical protein
VLRFRNLSHRPLSLLTGRQLERRSALRKLHLVGLSTAVSMEPVFNFSVMRKKQLKPRFIRSFGWSAG